MKTASRGMLKGTLRLHAGDVYCANCH